MKWHLGLAAALTCGLLLTNANAALVISEIMYNPASSDDNDWEYVELYNDSASIVDLSGYVVDDDNSTGHAAANIASGSIAPGGTAVLYDVDFHATLTALESAWGAGINWVGATGWNDMSLGNGGDRVGVWDSFTSYSGDHQDHNNTIVDVDYSDDPPWPADNGAASIHLTNVLSDAAVPDNWALSFVGDAQGGYESTPAGNNDGVNTGSPGSVVPEPTGISLVLMSVLALMGVSVVGFRTRLG